MPGTSSSLSQLQPVLLLMSCVTFPSSLVASVLTGLHSKWHLPLRRRPQASHAGRRHLADHSRGAHRDAQVSSLPHRVWAHFCSCLKFMAGLQLLAVTAKCCYLVLIPCVDYFRWHQCKVADTHKTETDHLARVLAAACNGLRRAVCIQLRRVLHERHSEAHRDGHQFAEQDGAHDSLTVSLQPPRLTWYRRIPPRAAWFRAHAHVRRSQGLPN